MVALLGSLAGAVIGTTLCAAAIGPAAKRAPEAVVSLHQGEAGAHVLVEAMRAPRPPMAEDDAARFEAVLAAVKAGELQSVTVAWSAFATAYFDAETRSHARALDLVVLASAVDVHAPELAKQARIAARFQQRRDRLGLYVAAVRKALAESKQTGKPVALDLSALSLAEGGTAAPMTAAQLEERLVVATKNMEEADATFSVQVQRLQQLMQREHKAHAPIADIMKTVN